MHVPTAAGGKRSSGTTYPRTFSSLSWLRALPLSQAHGSWNSAPGAPRDTAIPACRRAIISLPSLQHATRARAPSHSDISHALRSIRAADSRQPHIRAPAVPPRRAACAHRWWRSPLTCVCRLCAGRRTAARSPTSTQTRRFGVGVSSGRTRFTMRRAAAAAALGAQRRALMHAAAAAAARRALVRAAAAESAARVASSSSSDVAAACDGRGVICLMCGCVDVCCAPVLRRPCRRVGRRLWPPRPASPCGPQSAPRAGRPTRDAPVSRVAALRSRRCLVPRVWTCTVCQHRLDLMKHAVFLRWSLSPTSK